MGRPAPRSPRLMPRVVMSVQGRDVHVDIADEATRHDRQARRFFGTVMGGARTSTGWRIPLRAERLEEVVLRLDGYVQERGWEADRDAIANRELERALERRRSFARTTEAAREWKSGWTLVDSDDLVGALSEFGWSEERELRPHQLRDASHGIVAGNSANFSVPGSGKTTTALAIAASRLAAGAIEAVLVVGPLASFEPWETETAAALPGSVTTRRVRGDAAARAAAYRATSSRTLLLTGYQAAAADQQAIFDLADRLDLMLIVDESHRIKRFRGGTWAPALVAIARRCKARLILSGTPMPRSPLDLFSQLNVLWPDGQLTGSAEEFSRRTEHDFAGLRESIRPFTTRTAKTELGLPPFRVVRHPVELGGVEGEVYDLVRSGLRRQLMQAPGWEVKLEVLRRARPVRLLQAATNADLLNQKDHLLDVPRVRPDQPTLMDRLARIRAEGPPPKHVAATNLIEALAREGRKVVCWSNFIANMDQFRAHLEQALGIPCFQIDGRVPVEDGLPVSGFDDLDETREAILHEFLTIAEPAVLITNPASCSESISLHHACRDAVYLDRTYDAALYLQSIDRVHRLGMDPSKDVTIHLLMATRDGESTIDHMVDDSIARKQAAMEEVLHGAELHPVDLEHALPEGSDEDLHLLVRHLLGENVY